ncbi:tRNA/rRNA methyltransferase family protein [Perilla frutescens var. frutescens]|nr:tRNA/rRNA methyltransferase family protein [Perilla frutescens var. frutescens]
MAKPAALPLAFRISSRPTKFLCQFNASRPVSVVSGCHLIIGSNKRKTLEQFRFTGRRNCMANCFLNCSLLGGRSFSSSSLNKAAETSEKPLPWLAASVERGERRKVGYKGTSKVGNKGASKEVRSSWEESAEKFLKGGASTVENAEMPRLESRRNGFRDKGSSYIEYKEKEEKEDGEEEFENDSRWYNIRKRYDNYVPERPEVRRWNKQENWGRKTWNEAKESTLPRIVGEGVYGVGPVLAALSSGRREFYALYVQEGLDLSSNNKKKKDKKGFEKILKLAERLGLDIKDMSKHDLNMVVDNRPHQGLVLDASPLEMVGIKELDPISTEGEKGPLWLALDEVTDPQNLGAIIRSAYFFGASGVVLCAKNSAPLSGVVSKASAGSLELMELRSCKNMMQFLTSSAGNGWRVLGGSVSPRSLPLNEVVPGAPTILVLGSEGTGLRPLVERSCTQLIRIAGNLPVDLVPTGDEDVDKVEGPGQEFTSFVAVESLNVSVAAGVLLNHLTAKQL